MASLSLLTHLFLLSILINITTSTLTITDPVVADWTSETSPATSLYDEDPEESLTFEGRSLFWRAMHYYISYGALSANRIPCPPRSGRSYYTHNCFAAHGPVNPYHRGCSRVTRCRR